MGVETLGFPLRHHLRSDENLVKLWNKKKMPYFCVAISWEFHSVRGGMRLLGSCSLQSVCVLSIVDHLSFSVIITGSRLKPKAKCLQVCIMLCVL